MCSHKSKLSIDLRVTCFLAHTLLQDSDPRKEPLGPMEVPFQGGPDKPSGHENCSPARQLLPVS